VPRVVFVNRYFYPDLSATSQILTDLAFHLATRDMSVTVVTGRQTYTDAKASLPAKEKVFGVDVVRVKTTGFGRTRLFGRALDYASFYVAAFLALLRLLERGDIVVAKTDPPLMSVIAAIAARIKGATQINWLQDLFPEVAVVLQPDLVKGPLASIAKAARDWSLRQARVNVVLGEKMSERVQALGIRRECIAIIPNWADDQTITPVPHDKNPLHAQWGLEGKFVVAYSGNLGRAHEFCTILEAALILRDRPDVLFLIIGGGAQLGDVRRFVAEHRLTNVMERPYQARGWLPFSLGAADLHLVSLNPELEGLIVPSKFYGIAAAGRPTAFIGDERGEIGMLLEQYLCGRSFALDDERGLAAFIVRLAENPEERAAMGRSARCALEAHWSQAKAFERWRDALGRAEAGENTKALSSRAAPPTESTSKVNR
jgi:glycosyltransferase involved in cell wall biosynthesis